MHVPVTRLRAMEQLAERYQAQFEKLLKAEESKLADAPLLDANGAEVRIGAKVRMPDGSHGEVIRMHAPSRRAVVRGKDKTDRAVMVHRVVVSKTPAKEKASA